MGLLLLLLVQLLAIFISSIVAAPLVPAFFVLGDSLVDPGNNNYILSFAKSNFRPYGMQFDTRKPTGRFCNGRIIVDYLATALGLPLVPAYLDPSTRGARLLQGVNFASAGCGILNSTGSIFIERIRFSEQVTQFGKVKQEIASLIGQGPADKLISSSIVNTIVGSNDYQNNYLLKVTREAKLPPQQFHDLLVSTYIAHIKRLYDLGVRKLAVNTIPPIGCVPRSLALYGSRKGECIQFINDLASGFNGALRTALANLRASLPDFHLTYIDSFAQFSTLYNNPSAFGFVYNSVACCGKGRFGGAVQCLPGFSSCRDFDQREFFDTFHPTSRANSILANFTYFGGQESADPINILELARL